MLKRSKNHTEEIDISKRRWFTFNHIKSTKPISIARSVGRPPYAVDEDIFKRVCNGCGKCETACPNGIIQIVSGLAELDVTYTPCDMCGLCQKSCQTLALADKGSGTGLTARISGTCDNLMSYCDNCEEACQYDALIWKNDEIPSINIDKCIGCGSCISSCFIGAIWVEL